MGMLNPGAFQAAAKTDRLSKLSMAMESKWKLLPFPSPEARHQGAELVKGGVGVRWGEKSEMKTYSPFSSTPVPV